MITSPSGLFSNHRGGIKMEKIIDAKSIGLLIDSFNFRAFNKNDAHTCIVFKNEEELKSIKNILITTKEIYPAVVSISVLQEIGETLFYENPFKRDEFLSDITSNKINDNLDKSLRIVNVLLRAMLPNMSCKETMSDIQVFRSDAGNILLNYKLNGSEGVK